jgi:hypothetical protein
MSVKAEKALEIGRRHRADILFSYQLGLVTYSRALGYGLLVLLQMARIHHLTGLDRREKTSPPSKNH